MVYSLLQSIVSVACLIRKNDPTISLSEMRRTVCSRPKLDGFADGKVYTDNRGVRDACMAGLIQQLHYGQKVGNYI